MASRSPLFILQKRPQRPKPWLFRPCRILAHDWFDSSILGTERIPKVYRLPLRHSPWYSSRPGFPVWRNGSCYAPYFSLWSRFDIKDYFHKKKMLKLVLSAFDNLRKELLNCSMKRKIRRFFWCLFHVKYLKIATARLLVILTSSSRLFFQRHFF